MKMPKLGILFMQLHLILRRLGGVNALAAALWLGGILGGWWGLSYLRVQANAPLNAIHEAHLTLQEKNKQANEASRPLVEQRLVAFYDALGDRGYAEQQVKTLFAIAGKVELSLKQAEYKSAYDNTGKIHTYQTILPVQGSYNALRQFCEQMLLAIPFASLDEVSFTREAISNSSIEAKIRITFYLNDAGRPAYLSHPEGVMP